MKRKFLEDMGLTKEQVDSIMDENGKDIESMKAERDNYKSQLDTAQTTLKSFEGINVQELQGKITQLTNDMVAKDNEYKKQLADRDFSDLLKETAAGFKPRDLKAVMPFLDIEKLKASKNQDSDIKSALEAVKKDNAYLFQDVSIPRVVSGTPGTEPSKSEDTKTRANEALRSIFGRE